MDKSNVKLAAIVALLTATGFFGAVILFIKSTAGRKFLNSLFAPEVFWDECDCIFEDEDDLEEFSINI